MTDDDCGYATALSVLMNVKQEMAQKTPPAAAAQPTVTVLAPDDDPSIEDPQPISATKKRLRSSSGGSSSSSLSGSSSSLLFSLCGAADTVTAAASATDAQEPKNKRRRVFVRKRSARDLMLQWNAMARREASARFKVKEGYPDTCRSCHSLAPGTRRKVINTMYTMAACLNLELGTPTFGVLLMDRFLTAKPKAIRRDSILLVAMVCLNIAGKVADIDGGYCGSKSVLQLIRDTVPPRVRAKTEHMFLRCVYQIETLILSTMDNHMFELPPAMQCVAEVTRWHEIPDQLKWLEAAMLCDIFATDTASTGYAQWEAAQAVVYVVEGALAPRGVAATPRALPAVCHAAVVFLNSGGVPDQLMDPYYGSRLRHQRNPAQQELLAKREMMESFIPPTDQ